MELHLNHLEAELLDRVLQNYLGDLRMEVRDTDDFDFRQQLKADEALLREVIGRLKVGLSA